MDGKIEGKKWLLEVAEDKEVHDEYGDTHVISSTWIREEGNAQNTVYRLFLDGNDITNNRKQVEDKVLRKQIGEAIGYGKMKIVRVEELKKSTHERKWFEELMK